MIELVSSGDTVRLLGKNTHAKYRTPSFRINDVKDICTCNFLAARMVSQVFTQVMTMTRASERIIHDRVATDTGE